MFAKYDIFDYPYASKAKSSLIKAIDDYYNGIWVEGGGKRTDLFLHQKGIKELDSMLSWIEKLLPDAVHSFSGGGSGTHRYNIKGVNTGGRGAFSPFNFKISACWGICYGKGEFVVKHNHFPYPLSFCYYVNVPDKSSPFVLEGERIIPIEGRLILFSGHQFHWVPVSDSEGRSAIVGNIEYAS